MTGVQTCALPICRGVRRHDSPTRIDDEKRAVEVLDDVLVVAAQEIGRASCRERV